MKFLPEHSILSSFKEWFDHTLLYEGEAYYNVTGASLYKMNNLYGLSTYGSPHQQLVYNQAISGAFIPTASGLGVGFLDYRNGRTISGVPNILSGINYSVKEVNTYTTTKNEQKLIFSNRFNTRAKPNYNPPNTGIAGPESGIFVPCCIIKPESTKSEEFQLGGGIISKKLHYSVIIITDTEFLLHGIGNLMTDKINKSFAMLYDTPLNKFGDYKYGGFNYLNFASEIESNKDLVFIEDVTFSVIEHDSIIKAHPFLFFGKLFFTLSYIKNVNRVTTFRYLSDDYSAWLEDV